MANITGLSAPVVGDDKGTYPTKITDSFTALDNHDHSTGKGVAIGAAGLASASVTGAKLDTSAADASTLEVASGSMRIKDLGVVTGKINDAAVTYPKLVTPTSAVSTSSGSFTSDSATPVDVTNLSVTLTAVANRPILLLLCPDGGTDPSYIGVTVGGGGLSESYFNILEDGVVISRHQVTGHISPADTSLAHSILVPPGSVTFLHIGASAGSRTYKIQVSSYGGGASTANVINCKLKALVL